MGRVIKYGDPSYAPKPVSTQAIKAASDLAAARVELNCIKDSAKNQVIDLALAMAAAVVGKAVELEPSLLDSIYGQAIGATANPDNKNASLHVHPLDKKKSNVEQMAAEAGFKLIEDPNVGQNGCTVEVGCTQIDATLDTIMETLKNTLKENQ